MTGRFGSDIQVESSGGIRRARSSHPMKFHRTAFHSIQAESDVRLEIGVVCRNEPRLDTRIPVGSPIGATNHKVGNIASIIFSHQCGSCTSPVPNNGQYQSSCQWEPTYGSCPSTCKVSPDRVFEHGKVIGLYLEGIWFAIYRTCRCGSAESHAIFSGKGSAKSRVVF